MKQVKFWVLGWVLAVLVGGCKYPRVLDEPMPSAQFYHYLDTCGPSGLVVHFEAFDVLQTEDIEWQIESKTYSGLSATHAFDSGGIKEVVLVLSNSGVDTVISREIFVDDCNAPFSFATTIDSSEFGGAYGQANAVIELPDGGLVATGFVSPSFSANANDRQMFVLKLWPDGSSAFSKTDASVRGEGVALAALQDGRVFVLGNRRSDSKDYLAFWEVSPDGNSMTLHDPGVENEIGLDFELTSNQDRFIVFSRNGDPKYFLSAFNRDFTRVQNIPLYSDFRYAQFVQSERDRTKFYAVSVEAAPKKMTLRVLDEDPLGFFSATALTDAGSSLNTPKAIAAYPNGYWLCACAGGTNNGSCHVLRKEVSPGASETKIGALNKSGLSINALATFKDGRCLYAGRNVSPLQLFYGIIDSSGGSFTQEFFPPPASNAVESGAYGAIVTRTGAAVVCGTLQSKIYIKKYKP